MVKFSDFVVGRYKVTSKFVNRAFTVCGYRIQMEVSRTV